MDDPTTPADEPSVFHFLSYRISQVQTAMNLNAQRLLQAHCTLTLAQWRVLALIGTEGETQSARLSKQHGMDKGLLSRNLKILVGDGLVQATRPRLDRRVQMLQLTEVGQALFSRLLPIMTEWQTSLLTVLEPQELEAFEQALVKFEAHLATETH